MSGIFSYKKIFFWNFLETVNKLAVDEKFVSISGVSRLVLQNDNLKKFGEL